MKRTRRTTKRLPPYTSLTPRCVARATFTQDASGAASLFGLSNGAFNAVGIKHTVHDGETSLFKHAASPSMKQGPS